MNEKLHYLLKKLNATDNKTIENANEKLAELFGAGFSVKDEVQVIFEEISEGKFEKSDAYNILYDMIEFYTRDEEQLHELANMIIFGVAYELVDPVDGSRLVGSLWSMLGYPDDLVEFIGTEGELEYLDNRLKRTDLTNSQLEETQQKVDEIKKKLHNISKKYLERHTY